MLQAHLVIPSGQGLLEVLVDLENSNHTKYRVGLGDQCLLGHHRSLVLLYGLVVPLGLVFLFFRGTNHQAISL